MREGTTFCVTIPVQVLIFHSSNSLVTNLDSWTETDAARQAEVLPSLRLITQSATGSWCWRGFGKKMCFFREPRWNFIQIRGAGFCSLGEVE